MKYRANPVIVEAHKIVSVGPIHIEALGLPLRSCHLALENGENVTATPEMLSRITPEVGDYWVIQADGYIYLNPAAVFERKYSPVMPDGVDTVIESDGTVRGKPLPDLRGIRD